MEHIHSKRSLEPHLTLVCICSIRNLSRKRDIRKNPFPLRKVSYNLQQTATRDAAREAVRLFR